MIESESPHFHMNSTNTIVPSPRFFFHLLSPALSLPILFDLILIVQFYKIPEEKSSRILYTIKRRKVFAADSISRI